MTTYSDYDPFAWVYNRHWGDSFTKYALAVLEKLVLPHLPARARILDLCCGTGQLAQILIQRGYQVTGLDGSEEMLQFARENAPAAKFIHDDARSFRLPDAYHAVISVFDSLNHVMNTDELTSVFKNVHAALREGGLFHFDLNMEEGYRTKWEGNYAIIEDDHVCAIVSSYDPDDRIAQFDAAIFRPEDGWRRTDLTLFQKCHSGAEVHSALEAAGFVEIHAYAWDEQMELQELTPNSERAFFVCRKPEGTNRG